MRFRLPARFHVLTHRNFRLYWFGQLISLVGLWMQQFSAQWVVLDHLGGSALDLAVVTTAVQVPALLLMLYGGAAADRYERRRIMVVTQVVLMVLALAAGTLIALDFITFWQLLLISAGVGIVSAFDLPAQQALVPELVTPPEIPQAIALNQVIFNGSRLVGPALAGVLVAAFGLASAYFANGISYVAVIASLLLLRLPARTAQAVKARAPGGIRDGLRYVGRSPLLRGLVSLTGITALLIFPCVAILSAAFVKEALGAGVGTGAVLFSASGGASLIGSFVLLWILEARRGVVMMGCIAVASLCLVLLAFSHTLWLALPAFGAVSLGMSLLMGLNMTTIQQATANEVRGRVTSISSLTFNAATPVAALALGALVEDFGIRTVYAFCGAVYLVLGLWALWRSGIIGASELLAASAEAPAPVRAGD